MDRRLFLRAPLAGAAVAVGAGLLAPLRVLGEWPVSLFEQTSADSLLAVLLADARPGAAGEVRVDVPDIAEDGRSVPVGVETGLPGVRSVSILVRDNPRPLIAIFQVDERFAGSLNVRVKMAATTEVIALVETDAGTFTARAPLKVTQGGCGG